MSILVLHCVIKSRTCYVRILCTRVKPQENTRVAQSSNYPDRREFLEMSHTLYFYFQAIALDAKCNITEWYYIHPNTSANTISPRCTFTCTCTYMYLPPPLTHTHFTSLPPHYAGHRSKEMVLHLHGLQGDYDGSLCHRVSLLAVDLLHHTRHGCSQDVCLVLLVYMYIRKEVSTNIHVHVAVLVALPFA